jgi:hypothetical protein
MLNPAFHAGSIAVIINIGVNLKDVNIFLYKLVISAKCSVTTERSAGRGLNSAYTMTLSGSQPLQTIIQLY